MRADRVDRFVDCCGELRVENEIDFGFGGILLQIAEELCEGGTEGVEFLRGPAAVLVFADGGSGPTVVGRAADENHVRLNFTVRILIKLPLNVRIAASRCTACPKL